MDVYACRGKATDLVAISLANGATSLPKLEHSKAKPLINGVIDHLELLGGAHY